jgi:hypothetical protein
MPERESGAVESFENILNNAREYGEKTAKGILDGIRKANEKLTEKLEKNISLSPSERKILLEDRQESARKRIASELLQTRAKEIMIENEIKKQEDVITAFNHQLEHVKREHPQPELEGLIIEGKIKNEDSTLKKLKVQKEYLQTVHARLREAADTLKSTITIDQFRPMEPGLQDLFTEVDKIQEESDKLAGLKKAQEEEKADKRNDETATGAKNTKS